MSFLGYKKVIDFGDTVIVYLGFENMLQFEVTKGKVHQTRFGIIRHDNLVGLEFGCKVTNANGYYHILHPSAELWTVNLPHRTQILYSTDISVITLQLDLQPGSVVIESGTGSASLSHAILRTIAPTGHLYTFDFHERRVALAQDEFKRHGFGELVTAAQRDVCKDGFDLKADTADAVFLDLPSPWEAVVHAKESLKSGGRICSFSPCMEQVQRTCVALRDSGFVDLTTLECLLRPIDVRTMVVPVADLGFKTKDNVPGSSVSGTNSGAMNWSIDGCKPTTGHIELTSSSKPQNKQDRNKKRKTQKFKKNDRKSRNGKNNEDDNENVRSEDDESDKDDGDDCNDDLGDLEAVTSDNIKSKSADKQLPSSYVFRTGLPAQQQTGHTGFLTFATLYPL